ncbi:MAG TPA: peptide-methionine (S)-S-oxide reductase MsrA [Longimicrobiaceae bacterium]|nr:peptide-methionine (S)-S-oxide reductase MsrA [Longimicrobiaceae bacterium]
MSEQNGMEVATIAGGCFWCIEAVFDDLQGVTDVVSGYTGGHVPNPTYEQVCGKRTGHAEALRVTFDPAVVSYREILQVFFTVHDPTTRDRQGNDVGPQYRSAVFYHSAEQKATAEQVMREIGEAGIWGAPLVTEVAPAGEFFEAEAYHQNYFARNANQPYCAFVVAPKVAKFRKQFMDRLKR